MLITKKIASGLLIAGAILSAGAIVTPPRAYAQHYEYRFENNRQHEGRGNVTISSDFYNRHREHFKRHRHHEHEYPRKFIFIDREDRQHRFVLYNNETGPYSRNINTIELVVNHDFYERARSYADQDQNANISVNTGNNSIIMNTIVGDITTGNVNISIH